MSSAPAKKRKVKQEEVDPVDSNDEESDVKNERPKTVFYQESNFSDAILQRVAGL